MFAMQFTPSARVDNCSIIKANQGLSAHALAYTIYAFTCFLCLQESIIPLLPPPIRITHTTAIRLIARLLRHMYLPPDPSCICNIPYNIGNKKNVSRRTHAHLQAWVIVAVGKRGDAYREKRERERERERPRDVNNRYRYVYTHIHVCVSIYVQVQIQ